MVKLNSDAISDLGCNVVTSIVAETLFNVDKEDKELYISVYTLYRNFVSCIDGDADAKVRMFKSSSNVKKVIDLFIKDTLVFVNACLTNNVKVTIYEMDYKRIAKSFTNFKSAGDFKGVRYYIATTQDAANKALKEAMPGIYKAQTFKLEHKKDMYITTHIGLDLLPLAKFKDVTLIESHTGEFKDNLKWYTKLRKYGKNDMSLIPFNEVMYRIFGDKDYIAPDTISSRKFIYSIAESLGWYQGLSSRDVLSGITRRDSSFGNKLKSMFKLLF